MPTPDPKVQAVVGQVLLSADPRRSNPMTATEIVERVHARCGRSPGGPELRSYLHQLRVAGPLQALCAGSVGYYFGKTAQELEEYAADLGSRLDQIQELRDAVLSEAVRMRNGHSRVAQGDLGITDPIGA